MLSRCLRPRYYVSRQAKRKRKVDTVDGGGRVCAIAKRRRQVGWKRKVDGHSRGENEEDGVRVLRELRAQERRDTSAR